MPYGKKSAGTFGFVTGFSAIMALMMAPADAVAQSLTATIGVDQSEGDYGTDTDTSITVVPVSLRLRNGDWSLGASMAHVRIDGSPSIVSGGGGPIVLDPAAESTTRSGLGDLSLSASYTIAELLGAELTLGGRVKLPTGAEDLSTGKTDTKLTLEASAVAGPIMPFVEVGYRMLGDPDGLELQDGLVGSLGATIPLGAPVLIVAYDYSAASRETLPDSHSLFAGLSGRVANRLRLTGYGTAGLSDGAPDYGVGLLLSFQAL